MSGYLARLLRGLLSGRGRRSRPDKPAGDPAGTAADPRERPPRTDVARPKTAARSGGIRQTVVEPLEEPPEPLNLDPNRVTETRVEAPPVKDTTQPCRPTDRPAVPVLWVLDDGRKTGESIRIRKTPFVIGRTQGDAVIPHDGMISDPHAEIVWRANPSGRDLYLHDLHSDGGMFVMVLKARIKSGQEIRIGAGRYRFNEPGELVELTPDAEGRRFPLKSKADWIGRDPRHCSVELADDPMVSPRHAKLTRDRDGRWHLEDGHSLNGTWVRIEAVRVKATVEFLLGEQRFCLMLPRVEQAPEA